MDGLSHKKQVGKLFRGLPSGHDFLSMLQQPSSRVCMSFNTTSRLGKSSQIAYTDIKVSSLENFVQNTAFYSISTPHVKRLGVWGGMLKMDDRLLRKDLNTADRLEDELQYGRPQNFFDIFLLFVYHTTCDGELQKSSRGWCVLQYGRSFRVGDASIRK